MVSRLFPMIKYNDYEQLTNIIENENVNLNMLNSGYSLIYKAIEFRSTECFDLLIKNNIDNIKSKNGIVNGLYKAIEYYVNGNNISNKYYLNTLLNKNVYVDIFSIIKSLDNFELFIILFNRLEKNQNNIMKIIHNVINKNILIIFELIYKYLNYNLEEVTWYLENKNIIDNNIFKHSIIVSLNNLTVLYNIIDIIPWYYIINYNYNNTSINYPSLYFAIQSNNLHVFNYLFKLYNNLNTIELNSIDNIKNLNILFLSTSNTFLKDTNNITYYLYNILLLPIEFYNMNYILVYFYKKIFHHILYNVHEPWNTCTSHSRWYFYNFINKIYDLIYIILKYYNGSNLINPFESLTYFNDSIKSDFINTISKINTINNEILKNEKLNIYYMIIFRYIHIISYFNYKYNNDLLNSNNYYPYNIFIDSTDKYINENDKYIIELEIRYKTLNKII